MRVGLLRSLLCLVQSDVENDLWNWFMIPFGTSPSSPHIVPRFCSSFILCHWPIIYQAVCASSVCLLKGYTSEFYYKNSQIFNWYICALTYHSPLLHPADFQKMGVWWIYWSLSWRKHCRINRLLIINVAVTINRTMKYYSSGSTASEQITK